MRKTLYERARSVVPKPVKVALQPVVSIFSSKYGSEIGYWRNRHRFEGAFVNDHYRQLMLDIADERESFFAGKVVADFGCGPRGSLAWLSDKATCIGIDVLSPEYAREFPDDLRRHGMTYVASTENLIPLPSDYVDVMFTMNALDHASDLEAICAEIVRVMKPGALLAASFNLNEPATVAEPQTLTEELLDHVLLRHFDERSIRLAPFSENYRALRAGEPYMRGEHGQMWFTGTSLPGSRQTEQPTGLSPPASST